MLRLVVFGGMDIDNRSCGSEMRGVIFHSQPLGKSQHFVDGTFRDAAVGG